MRKILKLVSCTTLLGMCCMSTEGMYNIPKSKQKGYRQTQTTKNGKGKAIKKNSHKTSAKKVKDGSNSEQPNIAPPPQLPAVPAPQRQNTDKQAEKPLSFKEKLALAQNMPGVVPNMQSRTPAQNTNNGRQNVLPPPTANTGKIKDMAAKLDQQQNNPASQEQDANNEQQNVQNADDTELITQPGAVPPPPPPPPPPGTPLKTKAPTAGTTNNAKSGTDTTSSTPAKKVNINQIGGQQQGAGATDITGSPFFKRRQADPSNSVSTPQFPNASGPAVPPPPSFRSQSTPNFNQPTSTPQQVAVIELPYTPQEYSNSYRKSGGDMPLVLKYNDKKVEVSFTNFHLDPDSFINLSRMVNLHINGVTREQIMEFLTGGQALTVDQQKLVEFLSDCGVNLGENAEKVIQDVNATLNGKFIDYALDLYNDMSGINLFKNLSKEGQAALLPAFHEYIGKHFLGDGIYQYNMLTRRYASWLTLTKVVEYDTSIQPIANSVYGRTNEQGLRTSFVNLAKATLVNAYIQHSGVNLSEEDKNAIREYYSNAKI